MLRLRLPNNSRTCPITCECPSIPIILNLHFRISVSDKTSHFLKLYISISFQTVRCGSVWIIICILSNKHHGSKFLGSILKIRKFFKKKKLVYRWVNAFQGRCIWSLTEVSFEASRSIFERIFEKYVNIRCSWIMEQRILRE